MRRATLIVLVSAVCGSFPVPHPAAAGEPDCVALLADCSAGSELLDTVCGPGVHTLTSPVSDSISYVVFGPAVKKVTLTECGTGTKFVITSDASLCDIDDTNDNTCAIEIATVLSRPAAPAMGGAGLGLMSLALLALGGMRLRRRSS